MIYGDCKNAISACSINFGVEMTITRDPRPRTETHTVLWPLLCTLYFVDYGMQHVTPYIFDEMTGIR
jgi:hypothetical protein